MFKDEDIEAVEIKSSWKKELMVRDNGSQTKELDIRDVAVQSVKRKEKEIQTEDYIEEKIEICDDDSPEFARFISKAVPLLVTELQNNLRSNAFDGYEDMFDEESDDATLQYTLCYPELTDTMEVTALSWNATGAVLAASYGRFDHEDWCTHKSALCTWNLDRKGLDVNKPDVVIDLPCCLTSIAFHPKKPACIVGATFNGEIMVWDTAREDESLLATSGIGDDSHREPVARVQWVIDPESHGKKYNITTVGSDGKILVWKLNERKRTLKLVDGFVLLIESLPRQLRAKAKRHDQEMGVSCICFNPNDESIFLIGSESGGLFRCSANARGTPARREVVCSVPLRSAVTFSFEPHGGPVHSVECSPFHRNLFLSCGTDTTARLYSMLQTQSLNLTEPGLGYLYSAKWSPVRPLLYAVCTESGHLLFYDLKRSKISPVLKLDASTRKKPLYSLQFNSHNTELMATGDGAGYIQLWKLGTKFTQQSTNEQDILESIASAETEG